MEHAGLTAGSPESKRLTVLANSNFNRILFVGKEKNTNIKIKNDNTKGENNINYWDTEAKINTITTKITQEAAKGDQSANYLPAAGIELGASFKDQAPLYKDFASHDELVHPGYAPPQWIVLPCLQPST